MSRTERIRGLTSGYDDYLRLLAKNNGDEEAAVTELFREQEQAEMEWVREATDRLERWSRREKATDA